jgi:hypothetical protein
VKTQEHQRLAAEGSGFRSLDFCAQAASIQVKFTDKDRKPLTL